VLLSTAGLVFAILSQLLASLAWVRGAHRNQRREGVFLDHPRAVSYRIASAGGLAFIIRWDSGGFVGPALMGWLKDGTNSFSAGLLAMAGFSAGVYALSWFDEADCQAWSDIRWWVSLR